MARLRARGVSLWLMPAGEAGGRLAGLIAGLAARHATPAFPPHVTLLAGIEGRPEADALAAGRALAASLQPFPVRLGRAEGRDEPFRCLFLRVDEGDPLRVAHAAAARAFGREPDAAFLPHLSLVYGTLSPGAKRALCEELAGASGCGFEAAALHVWRTEGAVDEWRQIGALPFDRPSERR